METKSVSGNLRRAGFSIVLCLLLGAVGCFDYEEEVWLDRSGSGRAEITIKMPEQLMALARSTAALQSQGIPGQNPLANSQKFRFSREEAEKSFANRPGIRVLKVDEVREAGMMGYRIGLSFDSLAHLEAALSSRQESGLGVNSGGKLSLVENGRLFRFHRQVAASRAGPGGRAGTNPSADQVAQSMAVMFFANHFLTYRYHFPFKITSGNATRIDSNTNTAEWRFGLAEAMAGDLDMQVELTARRPAWFYAVLGFAGAVALGMIAWFYRSRSRRAAAIPAVQPSSAPPLSAARFRTREEYEAWKVSHPPQDGK